MFECDAAPIYIDIIYIYIYIYIISYIIIVTGGIGLNLYSFIHFPVQLRDHELATARNA
jgi:hypothetical protein